jgi:hypothetical protein
VPPSARSMGKIPGGCERLLLEPRAMTYLSATNHTLSVSPRGPGAASVGDPHVILQGLGVSQTIASEAPP